MFNQVHCPKIPNNGVVCSEWLKTQTAPCDKCGWNPENVDLKIKRIYAAIDKMEAKKGEMKK